MTVEIGLIFFVFNMLQSPSRCSKNGGFVLSMAQIRGLALAIELPQNSLRSEDAGDGDLFFPAEALLSLKASIHEQMGFVPEEEAPVSG